MKALKIWMVAGFILLACLFVKAGDGKLTGVWKITDLKVSGKPTGNCYLCDLYEHKGSLEFTKDGIARYYGSPASRNIYYYTDGNKLILSLEKGAALHANNINKTADDSFAQFEFTISGNTMLLTKVSKDNTETYTFTK